VAVIASRFRLRQYEPGVVRVHGSAGCASFCVIFPATGVMCLIFIASSVARRYLLACLVQLHATADHAGRRAPTGGLIRYRKRFSSRCSGN